MTNIIVGSKNPVKIEAVKEAFSRFFSPLEIKSVEVSSDVPPQPVGDEIWNGARNRAYNLYNLRKERDNTFFVGIEGGIYKFPYGWFELGVTCIISESGKTTFGGAPFFPLPSHITKRLLRGEELSTVLDEILSTKDIGKKEGAIGYFSKGVVLRKDLYIQSTIMALIPFLNPSVFER